MSKLFRNRKCTAALAAGAGVLGPWAPTHGAVIFSGIIDYSFSQTGSGQTVDSSFDFGGEATDPITFQLVHNSKGNIYGTGSGGTTDLREPGPTTLHFDAERMELGETIGPGDNFETVFGTGLDNGEWSHAPGDSLTGYLGAEFQGTNGTQYGWLRITLDYSSITDGGTSTLTIHEWAYETDANTPITIVPEPSTFLLFAAGVTCLVTRRFRGLKV